MDYFNSPGSSYPTQSVQRQPKPAQAEDEANSNYGAAFHGRSASVASGPYDSAIKDLSISTAPEQEHEAELKRFAEEEAALAEAEAEVQRKREELNRRREAQGQARLSLNGGSPNDTAIANKFTNAMPYNDYNRASRAGKASKANAEANAEAASPLSSASNSPNRASIGLFDAARRSRSGVSWGAPSVIHEDRPLEQPPPAWLQGSNSSPYNVPTAPRFRESFDGPIQPPPHPHTPTSPYSSMASSTRPHEFADGPTYRVGQPSRDLPNGNQYSYPHDPDFPRSMESGPQIPQRARSDAVALENDKKLKKKRSRSSFSWFGRRNSAQVTAH